MIRIMLEEFENEDGIKEITYFDGDEIPFSEGTPSKISLEKIKKEGKNGRNI